VRKGQSGADETGVFGPTFAGRYPIDGILGRGGMGLVLSARHPILDRRIAIKILLPSIAQSDEYRQRFLNEAKAGALIHSEHVVRVLDVATLANGQPYIVMEHLDGCTLASTLAARGRVPVTECVGWIVDALEAIAAAHVQGIVHRDLKPQNLFLARRSDGSQLVKVLDFGISKVSTDDESVTSTDALLGTPSYVSPEQARSTKLVDARTDIWSIGVVLFELLSGRRPFTGDNVGQVIASILTEDPIPLETLVPDVPRELSAVVRRCLARDAKDRFATAAALARALAPFAPPSALAVIDRIERMQRARPFRRASPPASDPREDAPTETSHGTDRGLRAAFMRTRTLRSAVFASVVLALALGSVLLFSTASRATDQAADTTPSTAPALSSLPPVPAVTRELPLSALSLSESPPASPPITVPALRVPLAPRTRKPEPMKPSEASLMSSTRD
jgi:eukaryotic-like serine/threonine-protein kinase